MRHECMTREATFEPLIDMWHRHLIGFWDWLCVLLQGLDQHLLEGGDLLQVSLNVTDVNTAEPEQRGDTHQHDTWIQYSYSVRLDRLDMVLQQICKCVHLDALKSDCWRKNKYKCVKITPPVCGVKWAQVRAQETLQLPRIFTLCFQDVLEDLADKNES